MVRVWGTGLWPPSTPDWTSAFAVMAILVALLAPWRRGRILMGVTVAAAIGFAGSITVFSDAGWATVMLVWLGLAAMVAGDFGLRWLHLAEATDECWAEWIGLRLLLGFGMISLLAGILVVLHALTSISIAVICGLFTIVMWRYFREKAPHLVAIRETLAGQWARTDFRWTAFGWSLAVWCFAAPFLWAVTPVLHSDAVSAHLPLAAAFASRNGFAEVAEYWFAYTSAQAHLLFAVGLSMGGQPLPGLIHFAIGITASLLVYAVAMRLAGPVAAWVAAIAFVSTPLVGWELGSGYTDLFPAAFCMGLVYCVLRSHEGDRWLTLGGVFGGLALATKPAAAFIVIPAALLVGAWSIWRRGKWKVPWAFFYLQVLIPLPWYFHNFIVTRNPFYPAMGKIFGNKELNYYSSNWAAFGYGKGFAYLWRLPYDLTFHGSSYGEVSYFYFGFVPLAACLALLFWRGRQIWRRAGVVVIIAACAAAMWFVTAQVGRYLLPAVGLMCVAIGAAGPALIRGGRVMRLLLAAFALSYVAYTRCVGTMLNFHLAEAYPYRYALGRESRNDFLTRAIRQYAALRWVEMNSRPQTRLLSATAAPRIYSAIKVDDPIYTPSVIPLTLKAADDDLAYEIRDRGYGYILIDEDPTRPVPAVSFAQAQFLRRNTTLAYSLNNVKVYKVNDARPAPPGTNLMINGGFDDLAPDRMPAGWIPFGKPEMVVEPTLAHSAPAAALVTQDDLFGQPVRVKPGQKYTNRLWARADREGQSVWLQVLWMDRNSDMLGTTAKTMAVSNTWQQFEAVFSTDDPKVRYARFYARAAPGSKVMVDDISVVQNQ